MYSEFWKIVKAQPGRVRSLWLIVSVTLGVAVLEGLNMSLLLPLLEAVTSDGESEHWVSQRFATAYDWIGIPFNLESLLVSLGALVLLISILKYARLIMVAKAQVDLTRWMRERDMQRLLSADLSYFHNERLGILSDVLTTQPTRAGNAFMVITDIISSLGVVIAYLAAAFFISPLLTVVAVAVAVLMSLGIQYHVSKAKKLGSVRTVRETGLQADSVETISGIHMIRTFLLERLKFGEFSDSAKSVADSHFQILKNQSQMIVIQEFSLFLLIGVVLIISVSILASGLPVIVALLFTLYRLMPRVANINARRQTLAASLSGLEAVAEILEDASKPTVVSGSISFSNLSKGIEFKNVNFSYDGVTDVLNETSFCAESRKMTAIIGASGAGKTTIIDLVLRHYDPTSGQIQIDGTDLKDLDLQSWRQSIGVVSQDTFLFNTTVATNIGLGHPSTSMEQIVEAARRAQAHDFIENLPAGYETVVGDRGWNLSGGQRQRLSLARAILGEPQLLILDEATSSLDSESERLIQEYIQQAQGTFTMLVVAHRMSTIQNADKIVVLEDGKIVDQGNWETLMESSDVLANYQRLQHSG
jgi:ABC-type multidrug transport system fused ATPase/permease subunit